MSTSVWLSSTVEKIRLRLTGMVVLALMTRVKAPP